MPVTISISPAPTLHTPPKSPSRPKKPALKIALPSPSLETPPALHHPQPRRPSRHPQLVASRAHLAPPSDLSAQVSTAIRLFPTPRRNQADFRFCCSTTANPVAPPPTPVDEDFFSSSDESVSDDLLTPGSCTTEGRSPKRVMFKEEAWDDHPFSGSKG